MGKRRGTCIGKTSGGGKWMIGGEKGRRTRVRVVLSCRIGIFVVRREHVERERHGAQGGDFG